MAVLGLRCYWWSLFSCSKRGLLFVEARGLLVSVASRCKAWALGRAGSIVIYGLSWASEVAQCKDLPASECGRHRRLGVRSLGGGDPLEKEMAIHSNILAWKIPWTEEPGGLQFMGSQSQTQTSMCVGRTHTCPRTRGLSCPVARGIFPGQESNPFPLPWQAA